MWHYEEPNTIGLSGSLVVKLIITGTDFREKTRRVGPP